MKIAFRDRIGIFTIALLVLFAQIVCIKESTASSPPLEEIENPTIFTREHSKSENRANLNRDWVGEEIYFSHDPKWANYYFSFNSETQFRPWLGGRVPQKELIGHSALIKGAFRFQEYKHDVLTEQFVLISDKNGICWKLIDKDNGSVIWYQDDMKENYINQAIFYKDYNTFEVDMIGKPLWVRGYKIKELLRKNNQGKYDNTKILNLKKVEVVNIRKHFEVDGTFFPFALILKDGKGEELSFPFGVYSGNIKEELDQFFYFINPLNGKKWPSKYLKAIRHNTIILGMTKEQVLLSWGHPKETNATMGSWGKHEQLIYGDYQNATYVYIENGILTSFQD